MIRKFQIEAIAIGNATAILAELAKPGRDPRQQFEVFAYQAGVEKMEDLKPGMKLPGIVTNVTAFGTFEDIGVHQDGLVHVSQLSDSFVKDPAEVVKVQQKVTVTLTEVDLPRKRIALSMKAALIIGAATAGKTSPGPQPIASTRSAAKTPSHGLVHRSTKPQQKDMKEIRSRYPIAVVLIIFYHFFMK